MAMTLNIPAAKAITVDVVSDTICPWCYIGKRRLEKAFLLVPEVKVTMRWRPFQLDATIPDGGVDREVYLARKFGASGVAPIYERLREAGAPEGIAFAFEKIKRTPNTVDSHRLLHWAWDAGVQNAVAERLFQVYFLEGGDIGDHNILADAGAAAGMEREALLARLSSDEDRSLVLRQIAEANDIGIDGVPCFIFEGHTYLPGAQPANVLADAIRQTFAMA